VDKTWLAVTYICFALICVGGLIIAWQSTAPLGLKFIFTGGIVGISFGMAQLGTTQFRYNNWG
jgi:hypothetical protein